MTCAKIRKIINNATGNCAISFKFRINCDHVTLVVPRTFKVKGSNTKITAQHNVSVSNNAIIHARISCWTSNSVKIIPEPSATVTCRSRSLGQILKAQ